MRSRPVHERFVEKYVVTANGCWQWTAAIDSDGYGFFYIDGRMRRAHLVSYEWAVGPVPQGLELDHLCRNRACCNPDHLEPVTRLVNILRGMGPTLSSYQNVGLTHCPQGHPYDEANTYHRPDKLGRECRACVRAAKKRYRQKEAQRA